MTTREQYMRRLRQILSLGRQEEHSERASLWPSMKARWGLWLLFSVTLSLLAYRDSVESIAVALLSPLQVVQQGKVHSWGVLVLCLLWLWVKRKAIRAGMAVGPSFPYMALGLAYVGVSTLLFAPGALLLGLLGVFTILFGRAALIPSLLMGVYVFAVGFPMLIDEVAAGPYAASAALSVTGVLKMLGYPLSTEGQWLQLTAASGEKIRVIITAACAGPATMAIFLALFALMLLDIRLPWRVALPLLLMGIAGTWLQSLLRLLLLLLVGYYRGEDALWAAHMVSAYFTFSLWYLLFCYLYFKQAQGIAGPSVRFLPPGLRLDGQPR